MRKKLVKIGRSTGIIIPPDFLKIMKIDTQTETEVEIDFDGKAITITKLKEK